MKATESIKSIARHRFKVGINGRVVDRSDRFNKHMDSMDFKYLMDTMDSVDS